MKKTLRQRWTNRAIRLKHRCPDGKHHRFVKDPIIYNRNGTVGTPWGLIRSNKGEA